jgi:hypothetical protein
VTNGETKSTDVVDAVAIELQKVAERLVLRAFMKVDKKGPLELPRLRAIADRAFPGVWQNEPSAALEHLLRRGIQYLDSQFNGYRTSQYAAMLLFNLDGSPDFPEIEHLSVDDINGDKEDDDDCYAYLRRRLIEKTGLEGASEPTRRRHLNKLRTELATVLAHPEFPNIPEHNEPSPDDGTDNTAAGVSGRPITVRSVVTDAFIARPNYETAIRQLRDSGVRHIWLHGDAGTGKTRLARAANRDVLAEKSVPVLPAGDDVQFELQLSQLLVQHGVKPESINATNLWAHFADALHRRRLPSVIVLDDLHADRVPALLGVDTSSLIMITSIRQPPATYQGHQIEILEMGGAETDAMIRSRLPGVSHADIDHLVNAIGGRPLAIEHSCAYIRETRISVTEYCQALKSAPDEVLAAAGENHERNLTRIYQLTLTELAADDALKCLDYLIFTYPDTLTTDMLVPLWGSRSGSDMGEMKESIQSPAISYYFMETSAGVAYVKPPLWIQIDAVSTISLRSAIRRLERLGLVRAEAGILSMHQLTRTILRSLRSDHKTWAYQRVGETILGLARGWESEDAVPMYLLRWTPMVLDLLEDTNDIFERIDRKGKTPDLLSSITKQALDGYATLATLGLRSVQQRGLPVKLVFERSKRIAVIVSMRASFRMADSERIVTDRIVGMLRAFHIAMCLTSFDQSQDGKLWGDDDLNLSIYRQMAATGRLLSDCDWELAHLVVHPRNALPSISSACSASRLFDRPSPHYSVDIDKYYMRHAREALVGAAFHYSMCHWEDAIAALEHAFSLYVKVGSTEATRGLVDTARRLARVHLRAGKLNDASLWLMRAHWMKLERSEARPNGHETQYRVYDKRLDLRVAQTLAEIGLAHRVQELEAISDESALDHALDELHSYILDSSSGKSRLDEARELRDLVIATSDSRHVPEATMYIARLHALSNVPLDGRMFDDLRSWLESGEQAYQTDLLTLQVEILLTPALCLYAEVGGDELSDTEDAVSLEPLELRAQMLGQHTQRFYELSMQMMKKYADPYWYARGACACYMIAKYAEKPQSWMDGLYSVVEHATTQAGRPDWFEKTMAHGHDNLGMWLLSY